MVYQGKLVLQQSLDQEVSVDITIESRHFSARDSLKEYIEKEISRLNRYYDRIISAHVILDGKLEKKQATVKISVWGQQLISSETAPKFEIAIESAVDKLVQQVKKYKTKLAKR